MAPTLATAAQRKHSSLPAEPGQRLVPTGAPTDLTRGPQASLCCGRLPQQCCPSQARAAPTKHSEGPSRGILPLQGAPTPLSPASSLQAANSQTDNHPPRTISPNQSQHNSGRQEGHLPPRTLKHPFPSPPRKTSEVLAGRAAGSAALREAT